jgi:hypothetical protein
MSASDHSPYANVRRQQNRCGIDVRELLKQEIYKQGYDPDTDFRFGFNAPVMASPTGTTLAPPPPAASGTGFEDIYIYFDSRRRNTTSNLTLGELAWSISAINNNNDIRNCVEMRIDEFFFPRVYNPTGKPEFFYYLRVFAEIFSAPSSQVMLGPDGNRFHFQFDIDNITGQAVKLTAVPTRNAAGGAYFFPRPVQSMADMQIRFSVPPTTSAAVPFIRVPIPNETVSIQMVLNGAVGYNPIRFSIIAPDDTTTLAPVGSTVTSTSAGVAVFLSGFLSNDSTLNTTINNNSAGTNGLYVTNVLSSTQFEIAGINATTITGAYTASMYIPKNRIAFGIRFTCVRNQLTNYIDASHD